MKKLYQVLFQDEWNNISEIGWYKELSDAISDINEHLEIYVDDNGEPFVLKKEQLKEYPSTFNYCFDLELGLLDEEERFNGLYGCAIRGFIHKFVDKDYDKVVDVFCSTAKEGKENKDLAGENQMSIFDVL